MSEPIEAIAGRVARRVVRKLIHLTDTQSGDDSGLINVWEEICVQVQVEQSVLWDAYDMTAYQIVEAEVKALPAPEVLRLSQWFSGDEETDEYSSEDVSAQLLKSVYTLAANWSNRRIRAYMERRE
jgi:hypothetical protein